ncbi:MAG: T9SS type A sorting domain-containing protein [Bacteroidia bacterium]|nr:T9SS type A sorting domain-containing protein [Bacteroidia bacterium]
MKYRFLPIFSLALLSSVNIWAQTFKVAIEFPDHNPGLHLQSRQVMEIPGTNNFAIVGDLKGPGPNFENHAFLVRTDKNGDPTLSRSLYSNLSTSTNGIRGASLTMDSEGNYYVGGASVQTFTGVGRGSERTITSFDGTGIVNWTTMDSNWSFEAVDYNFDQKEIFAFSGPDNSNYPADLMISRYGTDGRYLDGVYLPTPTEDEAVAMQYDQQGNYYVVGIGSADIAPMVFVAKVDTNLTVRWSGMYEQAGFTYEAQDASWHADGYLLVTGSAQNTSSGRILGFVLALNPDGSQRYLQHYSINNYDQLTLSGVASVTSIRHPEYSGAVLAGTTKNNGTVASSNVIIAVDSIGNIRWVQGYSDFPPSDVDFSDGFSDVIALSYADEFVATGQFNTYAYGALLIEQRATIVRAPLSDGQLDDNGNCLNKLEAASDTYIANVTPLAGASAHGGKGLSFTYQSGFLLTDRTWCTLQFAGSGGTGQVGSGGLRRIHPYADEFDRFQLGPQQSLGSVLSVGVSNPGQLSGLSVTVMDLQGRIISRQPLLPTDQLITVNTESWSRSLYLLRVEQGGNTIASRMIQPGPFTQ